MLTLELLRYRIHGELVVPTYLTITGGRKYLDIAAQLIHIYRAGVGRTTGEISENIESLLGNTPDYKVYRGLAKILEEYAVIAPSTDLDVEELRKKVFTLAAQYGPPARKTDLLFEKSTAQKLPEIAAQIGFSPEALPALLYADLKEHRIVRALEEALDPVTLIERYNTALAQAMLYRATQMMVDISDNFRQVFSHIKLARLMHTIIPQEKGYRIYLNGPLSLFANIERYGIAMSKVLPAVLRCKAWRLAAKVNVGGGEKIFRLGPAAGLKSHYRAQADFDSSLEAAFFARFSRNKKSQWKIAREGAVLDLKGAVLIPDFIFTHPDGRVAHLEIVGFWTPEYLQKKLDKLNSVKESNVVMAVPKNLNCSSQEFNGPVVHFKQRLLIKDILPVIEQVAR